MASPITLAPPVKIIEIVSKVTYYSFATAKTLNPIFVDLEELKQVKNRLR